MRAQQCWHVASWTSKNKEGKTQVLKLLESPFVGRRILLLSALMLQSLMKRDTGTRQATYQIRMASDRVGPADTQQQQQQQQQQKGKAFEWPPT